MVKSLLLTFLFFGGAYTANAQTPTTAADSINQKVTTPVAGRSLYTRADSLDAVAALFMIKRTGGEWPLVLALPGLRLMASRQRDYNMYTGQWEETPAPAGAVAAGLGLAAAGLTYMFVRHTTYSYEKLNALQVACEAGAPIPAEYRALLQPRHFAKAGKWRAKLESKAARKAGKR